MQMDTLHHFSEGLYAKQMAIPKGAIACQHKHNYDHLSILAQGKVRVLFDNDVVETYTAPAGGETALAAPFQSIAGSAGTVSAAGAGGRGHRGGAPIGYGGTGGTGGGWGTAGSTGAINTFEDVSSTTTPPTSGGAGGAAVSGNSNVTWIATGTRYGALV